MTSLSTAADAGPAGDEPPERPRARILWWPVAAAIAVLASLVASTTVHVPYYAISPGSALDVAPLVHVSKGNPSFTPKGAIYLCTVSLKQTTVLEALEGWLDPDLDVVPQKQIVPKGKETSTQQYNLQLMADSKTKALAVAFQALGYQTMKGTGARVVEIVEHSPAAALLHVGDTITMIDGTPVRLETDAVRLLGKLHPGDHVHLAIEPKGGGAAKEADAVLAGNPKDARRPMLGVSLTTRDFSFDLPFKVDIDSQGIGGPSAGLAFTLEALDVLTKGELTGGHKVAATGEIELDGSVAPIGGIAQKVVAVERAGVKLFLVPADEVDAARAHAGKGLRVEPVRNLDDALRILASLGGNGLALERPGNNGA